MTGTTTWLTCGVLEAELSELLRRGEIRGDLLVLDSKLHMVPPHLEKVLSSALERRPQGKGGRVVLVYGDCCPRMLDIARTFHVGRVDATNCAQLLLGKDRYRELMREEAFFLLPEWAARWKEIFHIELGLGREVARDLMRDNRGSLVYLDTGLVPIPRSTLDDCAEYTGLPLKVEAVGLDRLQGCLLEAETAAETVEGGYLS